jgi:uncharacterized membrane protein (DUF4010 family)
MDAAQTFQTLGISLALGLLVGLQRERAKSLIAGFRTFGLITVLGTLAALIARHIDEGGGQGGAWIIVAGLIGLTGAIVIANILKMRLNAEEASPGATTEIAALVMYCVGAYLVFGHRSVALVTAGAVAVMLYAKPIMHGLAQRMGENDMRGVMQFVLIALVILPVLPNEPYGPFQVLNPRQIWWMVVLVSGISLGGYVALKLLGEHTGAVLSGILGGVISSTATTVSYARRASHSEGQVAVATLVIMLASTVVYARVLFEVAVVARSVLPAVAGPIGVMGGAALLLSGVVWLRNRKVKTRLAPPESPTELKAAITFGVLFAIVLLAVAAGKHWLGNRGIYAVAAISGMTDMDAITLSTSKMAAQNTLETGTAWRAIIIATIANLLFKAGIVAVLGGRALLARVAVLFGINILVGVGLLLFWPW